MLKIFCVAKIFPVYKIKLTKFPVFSLSEKVNIQIPCFPCAVATLHGCGKTGHERIFFNLYQRNLYWVKYRMTE